MKSLVIIPTYNERENILSEFFVIYFTVSLIFI